MLLSALALALALLAACRVASLGAAPYRSRRARAKDEATLEQLLALSGDGIVMLDRDGRVRLWNRAMERLTGVAAPSALGRRYDDLLAGPDPGGAKSALRPVELAAQEVA